MYILNTIITSHLICVFWQGRVALVALSSSPALHARTCRTLNPACKLHPHPCFTYLLTY